MSLFIIYSKPHRFNLHWDFTYNPVWMWSLCKLLLNLFCCRIWSDDADNKKQCLNYVKRQTLSLPTGRPLSCFCHHPRIPEQPKQISWLAQFKRKIECLLCHWSSSLFRFIDRERSAGGFHLANRLCLLKESEVGVGGGRECLFDVALVWNHFATLPSVHILSATTRTTCPLHRWSPSWSGEMSDVKQGAKGWDKSVQAVSVARVTCPLHICIHQLRELCK